MALLFATLVLLTLGYIAARLAEKRGRDPTFWFVLGMLGGLIAVVILYFLPSVSRGEVPKVEEKVKEEDDFEEMRSSEWYYLYGRDQRGPLLFEDLSLACEDGLVTQETYVWCQGMVDWVRLKEIPRLLEILEKKKE